MPDGWEPTAVRHDETEERLGAVSALAHEHLPSTQIGDWPVWEGHGPLGHVLSLDCAPVSGLLPDLGLPPSGTLAFFYVDGSYDDFAGIVGTGDASSRPGFRVLHLDEAEAGGAAEQAVPSSSRSSSFGAVSTVSRSTGVTRVCRRPPHAGGCCSRLPPTTTRR